MCTPPNVPNYKFGESHTYAQSISLPSFRAQNELPVLDLKGTL